MVIANPKTAELPPPPRPSRRKQRSPVDLFRLPPRHVQRVPEDDFVEAEPFPMSADTLEGFEALIRAVMPPPPAPQVPASRIANILRRFMPYFLRPMALGFGVGLKLLDAAPMWRLGRFQRLRDLPQAEASALINTLAQSAFAPAQQLALMFRGAILSMYFDQPEVHAGLNFHPERHMNARVDFRNRLLAGKRARKTDHIPWPDRHASPDADAPTGETR